MVKKKARKTHGTQKIFTFKGIRFKVSVGIILILGSLTIIFGYLGVQDQRERMLFQLENSGKEIASLMAQMSAMPIQKFSIYQLEDMAAQVEKSENIAFCDIYDQEGNSLVHTTENKASKERMFVGRSDVMVVEKDIVSGVYILGKVVIGFNLSSLFSEINKVSFYMGTTILILMIFMVVAMNIFMSGTVVSPVIRLAETTHTISEGEFTTSDLGVRNDEIGGLARSVNHMSLSLQETYENLEARVSERTLELNTTNERLQQTITELALKTREISLFNQMNELLQACLREEETYAVIAGIAGQLFSKTRGFLSIYDSLNDLYSVKCSWETDQKVFRDFKPDHCWAAGKGKAHVLDGTEFQLVCHHITEPSVFGSICEPLLIQGEKVGLLHIELLSDAVPVESISSLPIYVQELAFSFMERYGVILSNLRLRETLRIQSVQDPLTGLYNRRHMEAVLSRESHRAKRNKTPLGIMMLDVDHFKAFNDTYGHEAGDIVLKAFGNFLQQRIRGEDIACRYGGEEFLLILPGASIETTRQRAESICSAIRKELKVTFEEQVLQVTISIGVSVYIHDEDDIESVLLRADKALYSAKASGRDRVAVS